MADQATIDARLQAAAELLADLPRETLTPESFRLDAIIAPDDLPAAVQALIDARWGYLAAITGLDPGADDGALEALYHFCSGAAVLTLRVRVPREQPAVPSLTAIIPSVSFYERELHEMLGIDVLGAPNLDRLFLPDNWPDGVYPLRKDFDPDQAQV